MSTRAMKASKNMLLNVTVISEEEVEKMVDINQWVKVERKKNRSQWKTGGREVKIFLTNPLSPMKMKPLLTGQVIQTMFFSNFKPII